MGLGSAKGPGDGPVAGKVAGALQVRLAAPSVTTGAILYTHPVSHGLNSWGSKARSHPAHIFANPRAKQQRSPNLHITAALPVCLCTVDTPVGRPAQGCPVHTLTCFPCLPS